MASEIFTDIDACADCIVETCGGDLRLALPLGLGKANRLANALYRRAQDDASVRLRIFTALTLEIPRAAGNLEKRFLEPFTKRVFDGYPELLYARDRRRGRLPENIDVYEFYMAPGELLDNAYAQQHYISSNYTHITRDLVNRDINVVTQLVTRRTFDDGRLRYSLSCNPDLTLDLVRCQRQAGRPLAVVGEVNDNLPFMYGDAVVDPEFFNAVVESGRPHFRLFGALKSPVGNADHMIGLYASALVRDGGTLQVGIGSLGDALVAALKMRHEDNRLYRRLLEASGALRRFGSTISNIGGTGRFEDGLYGATEMLVDGFLHLYHADVLKRRVYDDAVVQRLLNDKRITDRVCPEMLFELEHAGAIHRVLTREDVHYLKRLGVFVPSVSVDRYDFVTPGGARFIPDLDDPDFIEQLRLNCLGDRLRGGRVASSSFFLGPSDFYAALHALSEEERALINMTSVLDVNHLYQDVTLKSLQRHDARFINSCLIATLSGAVVSDGLEDQRVLSGVGGQSDFVSMAHALHDGRAVMTLRSTRESDGKISSNIRFAYGHTTIPRHMRDIVVTEYGIADLRGKSDAEVIGALLNITDSRYQDNLLARARTAGKLPPDYRIADAHRHNFPDALESCLGEGRAGGWLTSFPFGSDFTELEQELAGALKRLAARRRSLRGILGMLRAAWRADPGQYQEALRRMSLDTPSLWSERVYARLLAGELARRH